MSQEIVPDSASDYSDYSFELRKLLTQANPPIPPRDLTLLKGEQSAMSGKHAGFIIPSPGIEIPDEQPKDGGFGKYMASFSGFLKRSQGTEIGDEAGVDHLARAKGWWSIEPEIGSADVEAKISNLCNDVCTGTYGDADDLNEIGNANEP